MIVYLKEVWGWMLFSYILGIVIGFYVLRPSVPYQETFNSEICIEGFVYRVVNLKDGQGIVPRYNPVATPLRCKVLLKED